MQTTFLNLFCYLNEVIKVEENIFVKLNLIDTNDIKDHWFLCKVTDEKVISILEKLRSELDNNQVVIINCNIDNNFSQNSLSSYDHAQIDGALNRINKCFLDGKQLDLKVCLERAASD